MIDRADLEGSIRDIYSRFSRVAQASGDAITFQISDITTYRSNQFDEVLWLSLFDPPAGPTIETVPREKMGDLPSLSVVNFRSTWKAVDDTQWNPEDFRKAAGAMRAAEALDRLAEWDPARLSEVAAVSSFAVEVHFQEKTRSYRALVTWKPLSSGALLFTLVDHVVPGVDLAFGEERTVVSREEIEHQAPSGREQEKVLGCYVTSQDLYGPVLTTNTKTEEHSSGGHSGSLRVGRTCSTTSYCSSICNPYTAYEDCAEYGTITNPLYWHKKTFASKVDSIEGIAGAQSQCGYAYGCAVKSCLLGTCSNVSFGFSGYGASITAQATGAVLRDLSLHYGGYCAGAVDKPGPICRCCGAATSVMVVDLPGGEAHALPSKEVPLNRLEESDVMHHGQNVRYLMGEWALVSYAPGSKEAGPRARILGQSSGAFSQEGVDAVAETLASGPAAKRAAPGEQMALLVAVPPHEANSRFIQMPDLKVAGGRPPAGSGHGTVLVLADFADDHHLQRFHILHDTLGGVSPELARHLEKAVSLKGNPKELHRVVAFALLSIGDSVKLESDFSYLPKCCCGTESCI